MSYDLFTGKESPSNFARPLIVTTQRSFVLNVLSLCVAGAAIALPEIMRQRENAKVRKEFSTEFPMPQKTKDGKRIYVAKRLKATMETPAVSMGDLVFNKTQSI